MDSNKRDRLIVFLVSVLLLAISPVKCQEEPSCTKIIVDSILIHMDCRHLVDLTTVIEALAPPLDLEMFLSVTDSPLIVLKKEHFENNLMSRLDWLSLPNNGLTSFNSEPLSGLQFFNTLYLAENNLTTIKNDTFIGLSTAENVDLHDNQIETIHPAALKPMIKLRSLNLRGNRISTIASGLFEGTNLWQLDLGHNLLENIDESAFSGANDMTFISLRNNNIQVVHSLAFKDLKGLHYLDLSENKLEDIDSNLFKLNPILHELTVYGNKLTNLGNVPLNITSLRELNLGGNNIHTIHINYFRNLRHVYDIDLGNNKITTIQPGLFSNNTYLYKLNLDRNELTSINTTAFEQIYKILYTKPRNSSNEEIPFVAGPNVKVANNPWDCNTQEMIEVKTWTDNQHGLPFDVLFDCRNKQ